MTQVHDPRLSRVMGSIVHHSRSAFLPGHHIHDHILLADELIRGYSRKSGAPKCMLQLDLQKAYDIMDWNALQQILKEIGLPNKFIRWIMLAVTSMSYKFNIQGQYTRIMEANRGLRQRDLIVVCIKKWSAKLLSYAGRIQPTSSATLVVENF